MTSSIEFSINPKEHFYFAVKVIISLILYFLIVVGLVALMTIETSVNPSVFIFGFYAAAIFLYIFLTLGIFIGYIKGNAVHVSASQFSDVYQIVSRQCRSLGIKKIPSVYILQSGGLLNAFAMKFLGSNYVILYSEIVETAFEEDLTILEFIIGHELGHIKRNHILKRFLLFPSFIVPFLGPAYSRACEYTCDNIGHALSPKGTTNGLLLLASGKRLFKKVNISEYLRQGTTGEGFWKWFAEKVSSHPHLSKRIARFGDEASAPAVKTVPAIEQYNTDDHSKYMPQ